MSMLSVYSKVLAICVSCPVSQIESETSKKTLSNLERILSDYRAMKQENTMLFSHAQATWRLYPNTHHRMMVGSGLHLDSALPLIGGGGEMECEQGSTFRLCLHPELPKIEPKCSTWGGGKRWTHCAILVTQIVFWRRGCRKGEAFASSIYYFKQKLCLLPNNKIYLCFCKYYYYCCGMTKCDPFVIPSAGLESVDCRLHVYDEDSNTRVADEYGKLASSIHLNQAFDREVDITSFSSQSLRKQRGDRTRACRGCSVLYSAGPLSPMLQKSHLLLGSLEVGMDKESSTGSSSSGTQTHPLSTQLPSCSPHAQSTCAN